jgi:prolyl-tRNA editing enzyme YbaK/EbsC (Cys-tRNA(Pro) deacylase)
VDYIRKIKDYIRITGLEAEHLEFEESCHTVEEAAVAVNCTANEIVKNICMVDTEGNFIVAIVMGTDRASSKRVAKALKIERPIMANEEEVLKNTGFPIGAVPSFGFEAIFLVDPKVLELEYVYTGGGTTNSLIKVKVSELLKVNKGKVVRIRK